MYNRSFNDYVAKKRREYGDKFDPSDLPEKFIPYFESNARIIVKTKYGETMRGRVGVTTGWKPAFLLMHRVSDLGSSDLLSEDDEIIGVVCK